VVPVLAVAAVLAVVPVLAVLAAQDQALVLE